MGIDWEVNKIWRRNVGEAFDQIFDDKNSMRALGRIGLHTDYSPSEEVFSENEAENDLEENFENNTLRDIPKNALQNLDEKKTYAFVGAVRGWDNSVIAEGLNISEGYAGSIKTKLKNEEFLERKGNKRYAEWLPGSEALKKSKENKSNTSVPDNSTINERNVTDNVERVKETVEEVDGFTKDKVLAALEDLGEVKQIDLVNALDVTNGAVSNAVNDLDEQRVLNKQKAGNKNLLRYNSGSSEELDQSQETDQIEDETYSFSEVMSHLSGEIDLLEPEEEKILNNQIEHSLEGEYHEELFSVLNSAKNLKLINYISSNDSILDINSDEVDLTKSEAEPLLEELESVGIVSLGNHTYSTRFEKGSNYENALRVVQTVKEGIEDLDDSEEYDEREWSEAEKEILEEWSENAELIYSLFKQSREDLRERDREQEAEQIDPENHAVAEFKYIDSLNTEEFLERLDLVLSNARKVKNETGDQKNQEEFDQAEENGGLEVDLFDALPYELPETNLSNEDGGDDINRELSDEELVYRLVESNEGYIEEELFDALDWGFGKGSKVISDMVNNGDLERDEINSKNYLRLSGESISDGDIDRGRLDSQIEKDADEGDTSDPFKNDRAHEVDNSPEGYDHEGGTEAVEDINQEIERARMYLVEEDWEVDQSDFADEFGLTDEEVRNLIGDMRDEYDVVRRSVSNGYRIELKRGGITGNKEDLTRGKLWRAVRTGQVSGDHLSTDKLRLSHDDSSNYDHIVKAMERKLGQSNNGKLRYDELTSLVNDEYAVGDGDMAFAAAKAMKDPDVEIVFEEEYVELNDENSIGWSEVAELDRHNKT